MSPSNPLNARPGAPSPDIVSREGPITAGGRHDLLTSEDLPSLLAVIYRLVDRAIGIDGMQYRLDDGDCYWRRGLPGTHTAEYSLNTTSGSFGSLRINRSRGRFLEPELKTFEKLLAQALGPLQHHWTLDGARRARLVEADRSDARPDLLQALKFYCESDFKTVDPMALMLVEIRHHSRLRSTHGEEAAGRLTHEVAAYLQDHMQGSDTFYILHHNQIAIVMEHATEMRIHLVETLVQVLLAKKPFRIGMQETEIGTTQGVVSLERRDTPRKLLDRAQLAVNLARQSSVDPTFYLHGKWATPAA